MPNNGRKQKTVLALTILCLVVISVLLARIFVPIFDVNKLQRANEATAAARLRLLTSAEKRYAEEHSREGYACDLAKLRAGVQMKDYDSDFYSKSTRAGYRFMISGCENSDSTVRTYRILAIPMEPGKSGWRSFCTDETGVLRYTLEAPPKACFDSLSVIE